LTDPGEPRLRRKRKRDPRKGDNKEELMRQQRRGKEGSFLEETAQRTSFLVPCPLSLGTRSPFRVAFTTFFLDLFLPLPLLSLWLTFLEGESFSWSRVQGLHYSLVSFAGRGQDRRAFKFKGCMK